MSHLWEGAHDQPADHDRHLGHRATMAMRAVQGIQKARRWRGGGSHFSGSMQHTQRNSKTFLSHIADIRGRSKIRSGSNGRFGWCLDIQVESK
eukprot:NODE_7624_length_557_cov_4.795276_g6596_i0.p3 GENE.NODE_7624_length_557_cov_4.795276_g6596_i0~~NODE_7624_length_557_cov_4.795276_g6596_i0.p3  ORF type:complete len:93 (-),score=2.65 NODE_7624_length_557_cov_4.795276_g6596_i0:106-384(-)